MTQVNISDEQLVAFVDGQCSDQEQTMIAAALENDPALQNRLSDIDVVSSGDLKAAYKQLLSQAPTEKLVEFLDARPHSSPATPTWSFGKGPLVACIAAAMVIGTFVGYLGFGLIEPSNKISNWRESVAVYQMLYTKETVANIVPPGSQAAVMRNRLSRLSGLDIRFFDLEAHGLTFKRGQILDFNGSKLVQLVYLSGTGKPVAICFINQSQSDKPFRTETRHGLNIVHWVKNRVPAMVIGDLPPATLERVSAAVTTPSS